MPETQQNCFDRRALYTILGIILKYIFYSIDLPFLGNTNFHDCAILKSIVYSECLISSMYIFVSLVSVFSSQEHVKTTHLHIYGVYILSSYTKLIIIWFTIVIIYT